MLKLEVFDPAMCCSTGVCGPNADPELARFAGDLEWLGSQGVVIERINLSQEPQRFVDNADIRKLLEDEGEKSLPAVVVSGTVRASGRYPSKAELSEWAGLSTSGRALDDDIVVELAAIGAAIGSNCEPCFKYHYDKARKAGITDEQIVLAVKTAQTVKDTPAGAMVDLAARLLHVGPSDLDVSRKEADEPVVSDSDGTSSGCCGPASEPVTIGASSKSCC